MKLVKATEADFPEMYASGEAFIKACGNPHVKWNEEHMKKLGKHLIDNGVFVVVKTDDGKIAGFLGAAYIQSVLDPDCWMVQEMFWWVLPEYRRTRAAWLLMKFLQEVGKKYNMPVIMCTTADSPDMSRGLAKQQFKPLEQMFIRNPNA